ncbi:transcriptional repressor LexA [Arenimonas oryziterrae]|uniref:LexA repressor n=1 Tax=Arenimonas oryziterrae DSM 21050 = YC6267 TaxID=1121015 RepID=A0A091APD5_9GAMM|nr:transcriptional repressor LexA [Arenimonas oryziterrae]KFN40977.1 umuDC operon protein-like protein [Arenimonas oryziterrae DSM 21050 = YC6267]
MNLTDTQQAILDFITARIEADGVPPSQTEIAAALGFRGVRGAQYHLEILEQAGAIKRIPGQARGIRLCHAAPVEEEPELVERSTSSRSDDALRLPILGRVAAGAPIGADIGADGYVLLDRSFFFPSPDYLLKVKGDSMRDDGIFDGDLIGVHRTPDAHSGQIVVARIDDEITVKLLKIGKDGIRLLPRNPDYAPIEVKPNQDFAIEGLYCGLVRSGR